MSSLMSFCVWMLLFVLLIISIPNAESVRVLVIRENGDSRSEEEMGDGLSAGESEEIDFLMDLINNEARERKPPPVTTVRVIERKPDSKLVARQSIRRDKAESHPKGLKEYHVHYHNHQHKDRSKPQMSFDEDSFRPIIWDSPAPLDYDSYKNLQKPIIMPYSESSRVKTFRDLEAFLKSNHRSPFISSDKYDSGETGEVYKDIDTVIKTKISIPKAKDISFRSPHLSPAEYDTEVREEAIKDFETVIKPKLSLYSSKSITPFERVKKFQEFLDSEEDKSDDFLNKDRFAGFKDFSEIESSPHSKLTSEEKSSSESAEKKDIKVRDFAIVIKSKPRPSPQIKINREIRYTAKPQKATPQIPSFVNKLHVPKDKPFDVPRILDAAGGAPKYIDQINQRKYPRPDNFNVPFRNHINFNPPDHNNRFFHLGPSAARPVPNLHLRNQLNGWLMRRLMT